MRLPVIGPRRSLLSRPLLQGYSHVHAATWVDTPLPEDLAQMQAMEAYYKVELRNREENYNQLFDAFATCSPSPGLLDHDVGAYMSAWTSQSPAQSAAPSRASSPFSLLGQVSADDE